MRTGEVPEKLTFWPYSMDPYFFGIDTIIKAVDLMEKFAGYGFVDTKLLRDHLAKEENQ